MSKIGQQFQNGIVQDLGRLLAKKPIALKLIGNAVNIGIARTIRAQSPDTLIILRTAMDNWSLDAGVVDFCNRAMTVAQPFLNEGLCDLLESPNEPIIWNDVDAKRLNEQMVQCASLYKGNGFQPSAYQFSVGNPSYELWQYLNDGVVASDGWVGLHEYGAPTIQSNAADLSLRHRKVYPLLSPAARAVFKVIVSECGLDFGIGRPPDGMPTAGGYRAMPQQGDSEDYWIRSYTAQLEWWDSELAKDAYVIASTVYGYAMQEPWVGLGFDVANVDTDRNYFINWIGSGLAPIPPPNPEPEPPMTTAELRSADAFSAANVAYNKDAALFKYAQAHSLGYPVTNEYTAFYDNKMWVNQGYSLAIVGCIVNQYDKVFAFDWLTGEPYVPPIIPIPPTPTVKRLTTADLPPELGLQIVPVNMPKGSRQWYVVQAGGWKLDAGTELIVHCIPLTGPAFDIPVTNRFATGAEKQKTDGSGIVKFNFGHGSAFTPPTTPPNAIYCASPDQITPTGDQFLFGFPGGSHLEGTITFQEVANA